ncbi:hypothetical protein OAK51_05805 [Alphaproteobacteria bacterium]|nr:hypothetical protein [Alphaproteobacteria bacterium]
MFKIFLLGFLLIFISGCHQGSSYISRYGQSIVLNPEQTQNSRGTTETISDQKLTSLTKPNTTQKIVEKSSKDIFKNINFSSTKFLKGNADCTNIIRVKVSGSLSYDELMYELKKRAKTMGGNAIGIQNLHENKEVTYTNQRTAKKNSKEVINNLIKETNLLSSVTADIFKCNASI